MTAKVREKDPIRQADKLKYDEILRLAREIYTKGMSLAQPPITDDELMRGLQVSRTATQQLNVVPMTPFMKNMLKQFDNKDQIAVDDPETKAEKYVQQQAAVLLASLNGPKVDEYDTSLPLLAMQHYNVDCYRNMKENMRDIQPGQAKMRAEAVAGFRTPTSTQKMESVFRDPLFMRAVMAVFETMPRVSSDSNPSNVFEPFQRKHTNVGFKWWFRDFLPDPDNPGRTMAQKCQDIASKLTPNEALKWNISTAFGRNQRGKGRLLIAPSRVLNLYLNQIEHPEIEALKEQGGAFSGYRDAAGLKKALINMYEFAASRGFIAWNLDQKGFDQHILGLLIALVGAMRALRCVDAKGRKLCILRAMTGIKTFLVNGMSGKIEVIFGRMFSGVEDTNQGDGYVEEVAGTYTQMVLDLHYLQKVFYAAAIAMLVMGDDWLTIFDPNYSSREKIADVMQQKLGFEIHPDKGEFGMFFLQYRLLQYNGKYVMIYPWTRVLRSCLFKEREVMLGEYGWLLSTYQQLEKLIECPPFLDAVVSILYKFDRLKLGANLTVRQIRAGIRQEDQTSVAEKGKRAVRTSTELYDGDPSKAAMFDEQGEVKSEWITKIHTAVKASVARVESGKQPKLTEKVRTRH